MAGGCTEIDSISQRGMNCHRVMWVGRDRGDAVPMRGIGT